MLLSAKLLEMKSHLRVSARHIVNSSQKVYKLRTAETTDIYSIRNCNLANLPENYNLDFYNNQLRNWPGLSFVVEDESKNVVGYALARIEDHHNHNSGYPRKSLGHIVSVAVSEKHRGQKLGFRLIDLIHNQMSLNYDINDINLFCRASNKAATNLYRSLHYQTSSIIPNYYSDGEDGTCLELHDLQKYYPRNRDATQTPTTTQATQKFYGKANIAVPIVQPSWVWPISMLVKGSNRPINIIN